MTPEILQQTQAPTKSLGFTLDDCKKAISWEPNGKSPGNTPMAKLQAAQLFLEASQNPATGIDPYEVATVLLQNGPLGNATGVQKSREQMAAEAQAAAEAEQAQQQAAAMQQMQMQAQQEALKNGLNPSPQPNAAQPNQPPDMVALQGVGGVPGLAPGAPGGEGGPLHDGGPI